MYGEDEHEVRSYHQRDASREQRRLKEPPRKRKLTAEITSECEVIKKLISSHPAPHLCSPFYSVGVARHARNEASRLKVKIINLNINKIR
jgi:hypothetical protein